MSSCDRLELAARSGAVVTGVAASAERAEGLVELGAAEVVSDIGETDGAFDLILESIGGASLHRRPARRRRRHHRGIRHFLREPAQLSFGDLAHAPPAPLCVFWVYEAGSRHRSPRI